jgi:hypothetical protein
MEGGTMLLARAVSIEQIHSCWNSKTNFDKEYMLPNDEVTVK